jgi:hypothetical protein
MKRNPSGLANPLANGIALPSDPTRRIRPLRGGALWRGAGIAIIPPRSATKRLPAYGPNPAGANASPDGVSRFSTRY